MEIEFFSGWIHEWSAHPRNGWRLFSQGGLVQAGSTLTYRALAKPVLTAGPSRDSVMMRRGAPGPLCVHITASAGGQELHASKNTFRKLLGESVGGWQHQCQYRMSPPAQGGGQMGSYLLEVLWRDWHGWPVGAAMCWDPRILWFRCFEKLSKLFFFCFLFLVSLHV